jgi:hypothetical protein
MPRVHAISGFGRPFSTAALLALAAALNVSVAQAQAVPAELVAFRKAWAAAMQKGHGAAVAALAALPLQYEAYRSSKTQNRASYIREVSDWSTLGDCLAREKIEPVKRRSRLGTHTFNCDGHGFFFAQRDGKWRHTGYENSNE